MMDNLKRLLEQFGPSGNEEKIGDEIANQLKGYVDEIKKDRLGNVIAIKKGKGSGRMMLAAHMDQIGVMVTGIEKEGYLRFTQVGYVDPYTVLYHNVIFPDGTIGTIAREEKKSIKELKLSNLYIDIGASTKEDAALKVSIGDFGVFQTVPYQNGTRLSSGALDNRISCYILIEAAKRIKESYMDLYFVFTVQEESYTSGAATSAYAIEPDCAIVVDVTDTGDTPECQRMAVRLGKGPAIKVMDRGMICHPEMKRYLADKAAEHGIAYQYEVLEAGSTDGAEIHISRSGVPTGAVSIPARYIHTPQEMVDMEDVEKAIKLVVIASEEYKNN